MLQMILGQHQNPLQFQRGIYGLRKPWLMNSCKDSRFTGFVHSSLVHMSMQSGCRLGTTSCENGREPVLFIH